MAGETVITIAGNLTREPEVRQTRNGVSVASFSIASTAKTFDKQQQKMVDGDTLFMTCVAFRDLAENVIASLHKGDRVIATGRLAEDSYEAKSGAQVTSMKLTLDDIGPSLRYAEAKPQKNKKPAVTTRMVSSPAFTQTGDAPPY